jgi:hypothetical protein
MKNRMIWYINQLLPLHYCTISRSHFPDLPNDHPDQDIPEFVRWRMWFGRCYRVERSAI